MTTPKDEFKKRAEEIVQERLHGKGNGLPETTMYQAGWERLIDDIAQALEQVRNETREELATAKEVKTQLEALVVKYRTALEFYAKDDSWIDNNDLTMT